MFSATCGLVLPSSIHPPERWPRRWLRHFAKAMPKNKIYSEKNANGDLSILQRRCQYLDCHKELVPYREAQSVQKALVAQRLALVERDEDVSDMLIMLQHHPVYTLGTDGKEEYLNFDMKDAPFDVIRTERGGEVTYHGPGQLVLYPILNLRYHKMDLHWYLRSLEEVVIRVLSSSFSIKASRLEGFTGVWVGNQKVAAIGIRVTRWITYHGLALNIDVDLAPFKQIVPCGIRDCNVGSIKAILGLSSSGLSTDSNLLDIAHESLLKEFSEVFQLATEQKSILAVDLSFDRVQATNNQCSSFGLVQQF